MADNTKSGLYALTDEQVAFLKELAKAQTEENRLRGRETIDVWKSLETPINFSDAVTHFHDPADAGWIAMASELYADEGSIEVDEGSILSESDEGAYVMAWVWVSNEDMGIGTEDEDENAEEN